MLDKPTSSPSASLAAATEDFGWPEDTVHAIHRFVQHWVEHVETRERMERQRHSVKKALDLLTRKATGPIRYLGRDWQTRTQVGVPPRRSALTWSGSPIERRELKKEMHAVLAGLVGNAPIEQLRVKIKGCLARLENHLSPRRELKQEVVDCLASLDRWLLSPKPSKMSTRNWVIWNLAEFFLHTTRTSREHKGRIAWQALAEFLGHYRGKRAADRLEKAYKAIPPQTPRDTLLAYHLAKLRQHRPVSFRKVLHGNAWKTFQLIRQKKDF